MLRVSDLSGLWRRSLLARPDTSRDTTSFVRWLQGPGYYVDLRQPAARPGFDGVTCLQDLTRAHIDWLARQEGFAGELRFDGLCFEWQREIDFQPTAPHADRGCLWLDGDTLVEEGRDVPYVEHWHRNSREIRPCSALRLRDRADGRLGFLVRVGTLFMYCRSRAADLPVQGRLTDCLAAAVGLDEARGMVDCEISLGSVGPRGWLIERSTLPFKEGRPLAPVVDSRLRDHFRSADLAPDGRPIERRWAITEVKGILTDLTDGPFIAGYRKLVSTSP